MSIEVVGIDLAKNFFQVYVLNIDGTISSNRKVHRDKLIHTIHQLPDNTAQAISHVHHHIIGGDRAGLSYHLTSTTC